MQVTTAIADVLPPKYHEAFGHQTLNRLQSALAAETLESDQHLVVSAPTASGKTGVFELTLLRMLETEASGKALYLAPLKSLVSERASDWKTRYSALGVAVEELTSDTDPDDGTAELAYVTVERLQAARLIVATSEKWDSWSRLHRGTQSVIGHVALLGIDEVHMLGDTRGPTIEAVVARMRTIARAPEVAQLPLSRLRIVALSATIPNTDTLGRWLGDGTALRTFGAEYRPTPLSVTVHGYRCTVPARFDENMLLPALPGVLREHSGGRPALVFCASRKLTARVADDLAKARAYSPTDDAVAVASSGEVSARLAALLRAGVAYHEANMPASDRRAVEQLFARGGLRVLCATSGLALGVNLPAHLVVILGTSRYSGAGVGFVDLSAAEVLQMAGRAGRPQFDEEGKCVVMTSESSSARYENLLNGLLPVCSQLHTKLVEHLNAEATTASYMRDVSVALSFVKDTFLYQCALDPELRHRYGLARDMPAAEVDAQVERLCRTQLERLAMGGMIAHSPEGEVEARAAGRIMARHSVRFPSMVCLARADGADGAAAGDATSVAAGASVPALLRALAQCAELHDPLRRDEKTKLFELHQAVRFADVDAKGRPTKVGSVQLKTCLLLQARCGALHVDSAFSTAVSRVASESLRLLRAVAALGAERKDARTCVHAHLLARCVSRAAGWGDEPSKTLTQLAGIGQVLADRLVAAGVSGFGDILRARAPQLDAACFKRAPFGEELQRVVRRIPRAELTVSQTSHGDGAAAGSGGSGALEVRIGVSCIGDLELGAGAAREDTRFVLVVGTEDNTLLLQQSFKISRAGEQLSWRVDGGVLRRAPAPVTLRVRLMHDHYVGADIEATVRVGPGLCDFEESLREVTVPLHLAACPKPESKPPPSNPGGRAASGAGQRASAPAASNAKRITARVVPPPQTAADTMRAAVGGRAQAVPRASPAASAATGRAGSAPVACASAAAASATAAASAQPAAAGCAAPAAVRAPSLPAQAATSLPVAREPAPYGRPPHCPSRADAMDVSVRSAIAPPAPAVVVGGGGGAPGDLDPALDALFEQFAHHGDGAAKADASARGRVSQARADRVPPAGTAPSPGSAAFETTPSPPLAKKPRASRALSPPRAQLGPRRLVGLAPEATFEGSADDLLKQLRSAVSSASDTEAPGVLRPQPTASATAWLPECAIAPASRGPPPMLSAPHPLSRVVSPWNEGFDGSHAALSLAASSFPTFAPPGGGSFAELDADWRANGRAEQTTSAWAPGRSISHGVLASSNLARAVGSTTALATERHRRPCEDVLEPSSLHAPAEQQQRARAPRFGCGRLDDSIARASCNAPTQLPWPKLCAGSTAPSSGALGDGCTSSGVISNGQPATAPAQLRPRGAATPIHRL